MGLFSWKPRGFIPPERYDDVDRAVIQLTPLLRLPITSEKSRQETLAGCRQVVETALGKEIPDDLAERTMYLEEVVANMRLVRLRLMDRAVLGSIGNLLIDSGIRKGRSIDQQIPEHEVHALRGKATLYFRYSKGRL